MTTERINLKSGGPQDPDRALNEIKNKAVILRMAVKYVCEDPFLKKMGAGIAQNIEVLKTHIEDLEKQFVGKPADDINLNEQVEGIKDISRRLQEAEKSTNDKCVKGELGKELCQKVISLAGEIKALQIRAGGGSVSYTRSDSVKGAFGRMKFFTDPFVLHYRAMLRLLTALILAVIASFLYLFFTMDTEKGVQKNIDRGNARIESLRTPLPEIKEELWQIRKEIERIPQKELTRQGKAAVMDLNVKAFELAEKLEKAKLDIKIHENELYENQKQLEEMKHKSFFARILRR
ncbi:MAG: hypothetical protein K8R45_12930 [Desulfobacterales bacterium]|nr:hypothetical protein [Desulfobacterales bacterium]